jgi:hypothetical protein
MVKTFLALVGAAFLLTTVAMSAIEAASARQSAPPPLSAQTHAEPAPAPAVATPARSEPRQGGARACLETVRVVAAGYGEPAGRRCADRRDGSHL